MVDRVSNQTNRAKKSSLTNPALQKEALRRVPLLKRKLGKSLTPRATLKTILLCISTLKSRYSNRTTCVISIRTRIPTST